MKILRRDFIGLVGGSAVAWPLAARAQQSTIPVIGFLATGSSQRNPELMTAFFRGLAENGFVEGHNVTIEYRWSEGDDRVLPAMAEDLVRRNVAVMTTVGGALATMAAKAASSSIPIAFLVAVDPVASGIVASLNYRGGNLTGVATLNVEVAPKRLELLHELLPQAKTFSLLVNPTNTANTPTTIRDLQAVAQKTGLALRVLHASSADEIDKAFAALGADRSDGLVIGTDGFLIGQSEQLARLALLNKVPSIFQYRAFATAGGLMSYGSIFSDTYINSGSTPVGCSRAKSPPTYRSSNPRRSNLSSTSKPQKRLASPSPCHFLAAPTEVIE